jgi:hypothetical protein
MGSFALPEYFAKVRQCGAGSRIEKQKGSNKIGNVGRSPCTWKLDLYWAAIA